MDKVKELESLVMTVTKDLYAIHKNKGSIEAEKVVHVFLSSLVEAVVTYSLTAPGKDKNQSKKELLANTEASFKSIKAIVKLAISDGFSNAMYKFSGKPMCYMTDIVMVGDEITSTAGKH